MSGPTPPPLRRNNSSSGASIRSNKRASFEGKIASLTRKLSFNKQDTSQDGHDNLSSLGHNAGAAGNDGTPRASLSLDDFQDEHIIRSSPQPITQELPPLEGPSATPTGALEAHRKTSSAAPSLRADSATERRATGSSVGKAFLPPSLPRPAERGPPSNPYKRQIPKILTFFAATSTAVLLLQRVHIILAIIVAACAAWVLRVQLMREGDDLLWEAEWRTIESKSKQSADVGETALWMNHCLRIIWPLLNTELFTPFVDLLEDSLMQEIQNMGLGIVHSCRVEDLDQGQTALQIKGFKVLDDDPSAFVGAKQATASDADKGAPPADTGEYINMEVSFSYRGAKRKGAASATANTDTNGALAREVDTRDATVEARENIHMLLYMMVGLQKIAAVELPVWVSVLGIDGKVRLRVQILPNPPFIKTVAITFPSLPALELSARPLGRKMLIDAMQLPLVSKYILKSVERVIEGFISPRSYTVDVPALLGSADGPQHTYALGVVIIVLHEASHIPAADSNGSSDPFVQISFSKAGRPLHRTRVWRRTRDPIWMEWTPLLISPDEVRDKESIRLTVFDADRFSADDALGKVEISIDHLVRSYQRYSAEEEVSKMFECREEALQPMIRGGRTSGTLKYSAAFFGLAMGEGHSMSPHRQAMLKAATLRSFGATPALDDAETAPGTSAFEALKGDGKGSLGVVPEQADIDLAKFETPFDKFVKSIGLPVDDGLLKQRYERKLRVRKLVEMVEGAEAAHVAPPQSDRPSGILVWHIHNIDSLEIPSTQRTLTSKKTQGKNKLSTAEDQSEVSGSRKMPSSYVQVVLNDVAVFRTRTKPLNSQPFVNSGSERWVSDWTKTRIDFVVRDARQRESDAIIGVVGLRLVDVLKSTGRVTDRWPITGGVGFGKIRITLLFRSIDVTIPKALSGWNIGVLEVGACHVTGLKAAEFERRDCSLLFESGNASVETEDATAVPQVASADSEATVDYNWGLETPVKVPVRTRYPSNLFVTLRSDRSLGRHLTHAFAMLPLNRVPDDTVIKRRVPLFHTPNLQTFEQETLRAMTARKQLTAAKPTASDLPISRRAPILDEMCEMAEQGVTPNDIVGASIQHVGWLELTVVFNSGCGVEHRSLIAGDAELRMVYESMFALVDAGQRRPPTSILSKNRRRKLSLEFSSSHGTASGAAQPADQDTAVTPIALATPIGPSHSGSHRRVVSSDMGGMPATPSSSKGSVRSSLFGEDEDDSGLFREEAAHKRMLKRTQRGPAQVGAVRTMAFLKQTGEDAFAKMKAKVNSSSSRGRTLSKLEAEGVSRL